MALPVICLGGGGGGASGGRTGRIVACVCKRVAPLSLPRRRRGRQSVAVRQVRPGTAVSESRLGF